MVGIIKLENDRLTGIIENIIHTKQPSGCFFAFHRILRWIIGYPLLLHICLLGQKLNDASRTGCVYFSKE